MTLWLAKLFRTDQKVISWALYDWANSACSTTIMVAFVPAFLKDYWSIGVDPTLTTARLGVANSVTSLIVAILSPTLGALADQRGYKKLFCFVFMIMAVLASACLAVVPQGNWLLALVVFGIVMVGFNASLVFYDSLLPAVASNHKADYASSLGYSLGYLGGGILFLVNILMVAKPVWFGLADSAQGVQASFISVAIWWLVFSIPLFRNVPEPHFHKTKDSLTKSTVLSVLKLWQTFKTLRKDTNLLRFLVAFWLYIDGIYTVMTMAVDYGKSLNLDTTDMMLALLLVQFIGFPFSLLFSKLSNKWGCRVPILVAVAVYGISVVFATKMATSWHFYALSIMIGMVQGGVQALSRSLFSKMIPEKFAGEYFGLFNLVGKFAAVFGPLIVGFGAYLSGDPGKGMLGLLILFVIGGGLLWTVAEPDREPQINVVA
jgi:UMF1 family MFS transporter